MKKRLLPLLLAAILVCSVLPNGVAADMGHGALPRTGDPAQIWIWVVLAAVSVIGFVTVLYLLLVPKKKGKFQREESKNRKA